jgi:hypothetical protein
MKKTLYTVIIMFFAFQMNAQSNFKPATVTFNNQETASGFIDCKEWDLNPKSINFKKEKDVQPLTTREISGFTIEHGETFERTVINNKYSGRLNNDASLLVGKPPKIVTDTVFLRLVSSGKLLNLYQWENISTLKFYVRNNSTNEITELIFDQYWDPENTNRKVTTRKYVGQFAIFANDPMVKNKDKVMAMTEGLKYIADDLTALLDVINGGKQVKEKKFAFRPYAGLAIQGSTVSYSGAYALPAPNMSILPAVNIGLDLYPNYLVRKYKIRFNAGFSAATYESSSHSVTGAHESYDYHHEISQYTISLSPQIIVNFYNTKKLKINAGTGFMVNYSFYPTNKYSVTKDFYSIINTSDLDYSLRDLGFTIPVRAGIVLNNKIDIFAQYCPSFISPMSDRLGYQMKTSNIQLGANICF